MKISSRLSLNQIFRFLKGKVEIKHLYFPTSLNTIILSKWNYKTHSIDFRWLINHMRTIPLKQKPKTNHPNKSMTVVSIMLHLSFKNHFTIKLRTLAAVPLPWIHILLQLIMLLKTNTNKAIINKLITISVRLYTINL